MANFPYGEFDASRADIDHSAAPWLHLHEIQRQLQAGQAIRPDLAQWLGEAIARCNNDPAELMRLLGLRAPRGRPATHASLDWLDWGGRINELQDSGLSAEAAIEQAQQEYQDATGKEPPDRSTFQRWRDTYRRASETEE
jgi:hypothetical protein